MELLMLALFVVLGVATWLLIELVVALEPRR
jgi:hypothetical protein